MDSEPRKVLNIGHRGASGLAPENTMLAFSLALELGADGVELDVHETSDGRFAVHHDPDVSGLPIRGFSFSELKLRHRGDGPRGLIRLEEALGLLAGGDRRTVFVEVKELRTPGRMIELADSWRERLDLCLQSFRSDILSGLSAAAGRAGAAAPALGLIADAPGPDPAASAAAAGAGWISLRHTSVTADLVAGLHRAGVSVAAWTVNDENGIRRILRTGVDAVISDRPDRVRAVLADTPGRS